MSFSGKEIILLVIGTALAFASFKTDDPLVFFPCIGMSWAAFVYICVSHPGSLLLRVVIAVAISCVFVFVGFRTYKAPQPTAAPIPVTLDNVDAYVKSWVRSFPDNFEGGRTTDDPRPEFYFGYHVIFADDIGIAIARSKDKRYNHLIRLGARIRLPDRVIAAYDSLSPDKKRQFARDMETEVFRQRMNVDKIEPPQPINIDKMIPITAALNSEVFYSSLTDMHDDIRLLMNAIDKSLTELNMPTMPSPTPNTAISPH